MATEICLMAPRRAPVQEGLDALRAAGHSPDVVKVYGFAQLPDLTSGRKGG
jgi:hypothetical protein